MMWRHTALVAAAAAIALARVQAQDDSPCNANQFAVSVLDDPTIHCLGSRPCSGIYGPEGLAPGVGTCPSGSNCALLPHNAGIMGCIPLGRADVSYVNPDGSLTRNGNTIAGPPTGGDSTGDSADPTNDGEDANTGDNANDGEDANDDDMDAPSNATGPPTGNNMDGDSNTNGSTTGDNTDGDSNTNGSTTDDNANGDSNNTDESTTDGNADDASTTGESTNANANASADGSKSSAATAANDSRTGDNANAVSNAGANPDGAIANAPAGTNGNAEAEAAADADDATKAEEVAEADADADADASGVTKQQALDDISGDDANTNRGASEAGGMGVGSMIAVVVGCLAVVAIIAGVFVLRKKKEQHVETPMGGAMGMATDMGMGGGVNDLEAYGCVTPKENMVLL